MDTGYQVHLVNTTAVRQYEGLKHRDDHTDSRWFAHLLRLRVLPQVGRTIKGTQLFGAGTRSYPFQLMGVGYGYCYEFLGVVLWFLVQQAVDQ